jgi:ligand-binding sensor domain-containing protein
LPATVINQIQRAANGYLWLATQKGLVRFDGERFSLFDIQNTPELRTNWVWSTLTDERGALWVATPAALLCYPNGRPGAEAAVEIGSQLRLKALSAGGGNTIWALSVSNEVIQFADRKLVARFKIPVEEPMRALFYQKDVGLMVASSGSAILLKDGKFTPVSRELLAKIRPDLVCQSKLGGFWAAEDRNVVRFAQRGATTNLDQIGASGEAPQSAITALAEDHTGRLWVGTRQGVVHCVEPAGEAPAWRQITPKRLRSLGYISCLYEDSEGLLWVGTTGGYLHQIKRRLVTMWSLPLISQESIPQTICVARDGAVWVGTDGAGAYRFQDGKISHFGSQEGLGSGTIISIFEDRRTNLWVGTFGGLFRL